MTVTLSVEEVVLSAMLRTMNLARLTKCLSTRVETQGKAVRGPGAGQLGAEHSFRLLCCRQVAVLFSKSPLLSKP